MGKYSPRELACRIALVPQELRVSFGFTVREMVMLGRTPYIHSLGGPRRSDSQAVEQMLRLTEIRELAERPFAELSGGE